MSRRSGMSGRPTCTTTRQSHRALTYHIIQHIILTSASFDPQYLSCFWLSPLLFLYLTVMHCGAGLRMTSSCKLLQSTSNILGRDWIEVASEMLGRLPQQCQERFSLADILAALTFVFLRVTFRGYTTHRSPPYCVYGFIESEKVKNPTNATYGKPSGSERTASHQEQISRNKT